MREILTKEALRLSDNLMLPRDMVTSANDHKAVKQALLHAAR